MKKHLQNTSYNGHIWFIFKIKIHQTQDMGCPPSSAASETLTPFSRCVNLRIPERPSCAFDAMVDDVPDVKMQVDIRPLGISLLRTLLL